MTKHQVRGAFGPVHAIFDSQYSGGWERIARGRKPTAIGRRTALFPNHRIGNHRNNAGTQFHLGPERNGPAPRPGVRVLALGLIGLLFCGEIRGEDSSVSPDDDRAAKSEAGLAAALFTRIGTDPSFESLLEDGVIPVGRNSTEGVKGSRIDVNNAIVEQGAGGGSIPEDIRIHTLCNSFIERGQFDRWTRWYQEDGNTQVFRLFKGEHNVRNSRPDAARVEAFSRLKWPRGAWHEWEGTYTIVKPHGCAIFQAKNSINAWSVMINLHDNGDIMLNHRRHQEDVVIATNMTGKNFDLKVRDNGHDYEVYLNGRKVGAGHYDRPKGHTGFRWGMYDKTLRHDAMIFVTGARFK